MLFAGSRMPSVPPCDQTTIGIGGGGGAASGWGISTVNRALLAGRVAVDDAAFEGRESMFTGDKRAPDGEGTEG